MIDIQNLSFGYGRRRVFEGLSLQFRPGFVYGLLGKNGTGKSTLLRNIAGLLFPHGGVITVDGYTPKKRQPLFLENIFMVPEEFHLPDVTTAQLLKHQAPFYRKFNTQQFENYCAAFEVPMSHSLQNMSYGQKKKALISFALASGARFLLMDEPTNGLDIISKSQFRKVMAEALDENRCMIVSTHQVKDLENLIDRVTVIDDGRILFDQTVESVSRKLYFGYTNDADEVRHALYSEQSLKGNAVVTASQDDFESKIDLELLYKAIIHNPRQVNEAFTLKTVHHE